MFYSLLAIAETLGASASPSPPMRHAGRCRDASNAVYKFPTRVQHSVKRALGISMAFHPATEPTRPLLE